MHLQNGIVPEAIAEHFLEERDHGSEGVGHPCVCLLEGDHEHVDVSNLVSQRLNSLGVKIGVVNTKVLLLIRPEQDSQWSSPPQ